MDTWRLLLQFLSETYGRAVRWWWAVLGIITAFVGTSVYALLVFGWGFDPWTLALGALASLPFLVGTLWGSFQAYREQVLARRCVEKECAEIQRDIESMRLPGLRLQVESAWAGHEPQKDGSLVPALIIQASITSHAAPSIAHRWRVIFEEFGKDPRQLEIVYRQRVVAHQESTIKGLVPREGQRSLPELSLVRPIQKGAIVRGHICCFPAEGVNVLALDERSLLRVTCEDIEEQKCEGVLYFGNKLDWEPYWPGVTP